MQNLKANLIDKIAQQILATLLNDNTQECNAATPAQYATLGQTSSIYDSYIGKMVVIRTYSAGVFYGVLKRVDGDSIILDKCRRIWQWYGANCLSDVATLGVADKAQTRIAQSIDNHLVKTFIEIIPMSTDAIKNLDSVPNWSKK